MQRIELVIARCREDLSWLGRVPRGVRVSVYDKGGGIAGATPLPNVGRESHTYLWHIARRYETLAPLTVFAQGKPFDHVPEFHACLRRLAAGETPPGGFRWLGLMIDGDDREGARLFRHWVDNPEGRLLPLEAFWRALWDEPAPAARTFYPGGHFVVSAERIRRRPRAFYERALELSVSLPDVGHCFERCWDRIFDADGIPAALRDRPLPVYFRPVRRLGLTWADVAANRRANGDPPHGAGESRKNPPC
jgi:hypothetical protein